MESRYDRRARTYSRCWAPVLRPSALALLDLVAADVSRPGARLLDVGTGSGTLSVAAAARFEGLSVTGLDVSSGMLASARESAAALEPRARERLSFVQGGIEAAVGSKLDPASFDAAVSSFVIQLIVDRPAALRAIREALRPGGIVALVTWADGSKPVDPEAAWERALAEALAEAGAALPDLPEPPRGKPFESPGTAVAELQAAGFDRIAVERADLVHDFGRAGGRAQLLDYHHAAELEALPGAVRALVVEHLDQLLDALPDAAFDWTAPLLRATARRAD